MIITDGQWWINIISSNQNEYITEQFIGLLGLFINLHFPLLILALLFTVYELYFTRVSVYSIWFIISLASTVGAGKWGAGDSYFATTLASACVLAGIFTARSLKNKWNIPNSHYLSSILRSIPLNPKLLTLISLTLLLIYGGLVIKLPTSGVYEPIAEFLNISPKPGHRYPLYDSAVWTVGYAVTGHFPTEQDYENGWYITEQVQATEGLVISEDAGFVIQANREVITNAVQLRNLWENNLYDPSNLLELVENQDIGLIIRRADLFPVPILLAIDEYYELDETVMMNGFNYELWIPKVAQEVQNN